MKHVPIFQADSPATDEISLSLSRSLASRATILYVYTYPLAARSKKLSRAVSGGGGAGGWGGIDKLPGKWLLGSMNLDKALVVSLISDVTFVCKQSPPPFRHVASYGPHGSMLSLSPSYTCILYSL